ncbi:MAG: hypothetical protein Q7S59_06910 [Sulfurimonas sp.]|nr:hypothetical protein [Sulfurimonas sp.]
MPAAAATSIITPELIKAGYDAGLAVYKLQAFTLISSITWLILALVFTVGAWGWGLFTVYQVLQNTKGSGSPNPLGGITTTALTLVFSPILFLLLANFFELAFSQNPFNLISHAVGLNYSSIVSAPEFSNTPYLKGMAALLSLLSSVAPWLITVVYLLNMLLSMLYFFTHINIEMLMSAGTSNGQKGLFLKFVLVVGTIFAFSLLSVLYSFLVNFIFFHNGNTTFSSFGSVSDSIHLIKQMAVTAMRWGLTSSFN